MQKRECVLDKSERLLVAKEDVCRGVESTLKDSL